MNGTDADDDDDDVFVVVVAVAAAAAVAADLHPTHYRMLYFASIVAFFLHPWT